MARAVNQRLLSCTIADELDPEVIRGAGGPDTSEIATEIVHPKRWVTFIGVEEPERLRKTFLICGAELHERVGESAVKSSVLAVVC